MSKLPRRLYKTVRVVAQALKASDAFPCLSAFTIYGGNGQPLQFPIYEIQLDDHPLRTQAGHPLVLYSKPLALAIAQEWQAQREVVDRGRMRLTGLAFTAVDNSQSESKSNLSAKILEYLDSDTLLYFANKGETGGERLLELQQQRWAPIIRWVNTKHNVELLATQHITHAPCVPDESRQRLEGFLLAHNFASLTALLYGVESVKSLLVVLATVGHHVDVDEAVRLARLEQNFQTSTWGNVEWCHGIEELELTSRLAAATLFVNLCSNVYEFEQVMNENGDRSDAKA